MQSLLKTSKQYIESIEIELELRELSARAQIELLELHRAGQDSKLAAMVCKHGVVEWASETPESIESNLPGKALSEIASAIYKLSGIDVATAVDLDGKKNNSEIDLSVDSSFASQLT